MRRALKVAAVVMLAACGGDGDPIGATGNGSIRGTVMDNTGATVANASVALTGNGQSARTTNAGSDGVYTFANVVPGTYTLAVTPPAGFTIGAAATASVTVASEAQADASVFVLNRMPAAYGSIRGVVTDNSGAAVADAVVALAGNGQARTTNSGFNGVYIFTDVPPGAYMLTVTPPTGFTVSTGTANVTVASGSEANASLFVLNRPDPCVVARPDFGGAATAKDREVFAYNVNAPLNLQQTVESTQNGIQFSGISYSSPDGGLVPGILVEPTNRTGLRPGIVVLHPSAQNARGMGPYATYLAQNGAVVIAIDAPYWRRGGTSIPLFTATDRLEQIQLIKDLQRAVDVLRAHPNVDDDRIGFEGYSYGGIIGALFVGVEERLKAAVLAAAHGGQVTGATASTNLGWLAVNTTCATRTTWFQSMVPIEGIRFIPNAAPTELLFQMGRFDTAVLFPDAQALANAASNPKEIRIYETGHGLNAQALYDRHLWLSQKLGIDAPPLP